MKIIVVGTELFHADRPTDGQIDVTKPIVTFRNFANAPESYYRNNSSRLHNDCSRYICRNVMFINYT